MLAAGGGNLSRFLCEYNNPGSSGLSLLSDGVSQYTGVAKLRIEPLRVNSPLLGAIQASTKVTDPPLLAAGDSFSHSLLKWCFHED